MTIATFLVQPMGKLSGFDTLIIALYMVICVIIGVRNAGKIRDIKTFAIGTGSISTFVLVATMYATHLGAGLTFGAIEQIRNMGLLFAVAMLIAPLRWMFSVLVFGRNIQRFRGCMSQSDIMEQLYGSAGRWASNITAIFGAVGTVAAQASAMGYLLHYYLGMPVIEGMLLGIGVLVLYSTMGGIRAVAMTDVLQFIIFYVAIPYVCIVGVHHVGGLEMLLNTVPQEKLSLSATPQDVLMLFSLVVGYFMFEGSCGPFIQRFLMVYDSKQLVSSFKMVALLDVVISTLLCLLGFIILSALPDAGARNEGFFELVNMLVPIGIRGLIVMGLIAIIMSTADSWLNTSSVIIAHDMAKKIWPKMSDAAELMLARVSTFVVGVAAVILAVSYNGILEVIWLLSNFYNPIMSIPLVAGFLGLQTNARSFIAAVICGTSTTMLTAHLYGQLGVVSMTCGIAGSAVGLFTMHYWQLVTGRLEITSVPNTADERV